MPARLAAVPLLLLSAPMPAAVPMPVMEIASTPMFWPFKSSVAPAATFVPRPVLPSAEAFPNWRVPAFTFVRPR